MSIRRESVGTSHHASGSRRVSPTRPASDCVIPATSPNCCDPVSTKRPGVRCSSTLPCGCENRSGQQGDASAINSSPCGNPWKPQLLLEVGSFFARHYIPENRKPKPQTNWSTPLRDAKRPPLTYRQRDRRGSGSQDGKNACFVRIEGAAGDQENCDRRYVLPVGLNC